MEYDFYIEKKPEPDILGSQVAPRHIKEKLRDRYCFPDTVLKQESRLDSL